jgi:hypothetical protein
MSVIVTHGFCKDLLLGIFKNYHQGSLSNANYVPWYLEKTLEKIDKEDRYIFFDTLSIVYAGMESEGIFNDQKFGEYFCSEFESWLKDRTRSPIIDVSENTKVKSSASTKDLNKLTIKESTFVRPSYYEYVIDTLSKEKVLVDGTWKGIPGMYKHEPAKQRNALIETLIEKKIIWYKKDKSSSGVFNISGKKRAEIAKEFLGATEGDHSSYPNDEDEINRDYYNFFYSKFEPAGKPEEYPSGNRIPERYHHTSIKR